MDRPKVVYLKFHSIPQTEGEVALVAEAIDPRTQEPVMCLALPAMARWLAEAQYKWRKGSNGIWEQAA